MPANTIIEPTNLSGFGAFGADDPKEVQAMFNSWATEGDGVGIKGIFARFGMPAGAVMAAAGVGMLALGVKGPGIPLAVVGAATAVGGHLYKQSVLKQITG
jgi:hypothetical protein